MDPVTRRLRRQLQMSSMHARQRNKNASTMLHRKLTAIDRRQQQNARALARSRYAVLRELDEYARTADVNNTHGTDVLPPLSANMKAKTGSFVRESLQQRVPIKTRDRTVESEYLQKSVSLKSKSEPADGQNTQEMSARDTNTLKSNQLASAIVSKCEIRSTPENYNNDNNVQEQSLQHVELLNARCHGGLHAKNKTASLSCRFSAFSPKCQCRYFPCTRPRTYHKLGVDKAYDYEHRFSLSEEDSITVTWMKNGVDTKVTQSNGSQNGRTSLPVFSQQNKNDSLLYASAQVQDLNRSPNASSKSLESDGSVEGKGHISPRTSIPERMRGLRQLVRELREKNEKKRPRDWTINYGDPVSRRLLRKPAIPVSDQTC